jgi:ABC-type phosphate/phosphonate transport system substrate-binding protein
MKSLLLRLLAICLLANGRVFSADESLLVVVMDPLCKELACDCVKGYAQRNYRVLAAHMQRKMGLRVDVVHGETIEAALKDTDRVPGIIIGKSSVVLSQAKLNSLDVAPVARLTGKDGATDQYGLIVVRKDSKATKAQDLKGYRILFGPEDCDEKSAAAVALLKSSGVEVPAKLETSPSCSTAAEALMKLKADVQAAAVISSYAEPLLAGCGTIQAGDLRIVGKTKPVPFITAFANKALPAKLTTAATEALLDTGADVDLLKTMESLIGFVELDAAPVKKAPAKAVPGEPALDKSGAQWNQFRGPNRDGIAPRLPARLPAKPEFAWQVELPSDGVGGLAATDRHVVISGRDGLDQADFFFASTRVPALSSGASAFPLRYASR